MIVTSKRCFINVLAQYMDLKTLLDANYFIADARVQSGSMIFDDELRFNEDGQLVVEKQPTVVDKALSRYHIRYSKSELDPSVFMTNQLIGGKGTIGDSCEAFIKYLNNTETIAEIYQYLYGEKLRGNELRIMIYNDDDSVRYYVHVVCQFLAKNFGEDITFIDPQYRPNVYGQSFYPGDKEYARKTIHDLRDYLLLKQFNQAIAQMGYDENVGNLSIWLNAFPPDELMHIYELIFPNDPLPPGNYTTDHIKQIIVGRVSDHLPKTQFALPNLYTTDEYLESLRQELNELGY